MRRVASSPVHLGHADVHHDDIRVQRAYLFECLGAGCGLPNNVDVVARVKQRAEPGTDHRLILGEYGSTNQAIIGSLARTGRLVTCAALILAISFASLSTAPDIVVEMIATTLAFGVLIDAVIVRTLLVPAIVAIMGQWNWWMPDGFARLLRLPQPSEPTGRQARDTPRPVAHKPAAKPRTARDADVRPAEQAGRAIRQSTSHP